MSIHLTLHQFSFRHLAFYLTVIDGPGGVPTFFLGVFPGFCKKGVPTLFPPVFPAKDASREFELIVSPLSQQIAASLLTARWETETNVFISRFRTQNTLAYLPKSE